ncbi:ATP-binding cassette domain-containing protein [Ruminococcus sp.]|uniref:ABC transporter ATP-binding protein n=1 Tax=Ruminococcus sp. TaxID=41978 RepID=UPI00258F1AB6|nr:ATP-binding cassette domain-containing protein [Ruminococcus sp.]MCR5020975.1 ABC transporter ATP-binding protein [Ruminococcus sp.]
MIEVVNLSKHYGDKKAVNNISFKAEDSEVLGFLGPNGAGKSTTMNILTGYISCTSGKALIDGIDILEDPVKAKKNIGYLPEIPPLYVDMTVKEYLYFIYDLKKCKLPKISHLQDICSLVKIDHVYNRLIKNLSKGYRQRVGLAQALVGNPKVLILDEPTVGLDPKQIIEIRTLIRKLGKNHTVILSSHILSEVQAVCDKIVVINEGRVVANDTEENLSHKLTGDNKFICKADGNKDSVMRLIQGIDGVDKVYCDAEHKNNICDYRIEAAEGKEIRYELFRKMADNGFTILELKSTEMNLEDIFLKLTMGENIPALEENNDEEADN